jgi:outer membrane receptor protein involved in Fe transport
MGAGLHPPAARIAKVVSDIVRALPVGAPLALLAVPPCLAAAVEPQGLTADIPAQALSQALAAFAQQTGLQFVYVSGVIRDQKSHFAPAGLGARDALVRLLEGTELRFEYLTPRSVRILAPLPAPPAAALPGGESQEVIVTATRRREEQQEVPITLQVLTQETLARLNATTFDDFLSYLPGVTAHGVGPGQNNIYMRGLGTGEFGNQASGSNGAFPNVAIYLDEQSTQLPGRNLDLYAADLERIEVLEGPQGTLFGAGAEAGVLRYITNKPQLNVTEAALNAGYATTAHGGPSTALDAVLNLPLIEDTLAVRGVIYHEIRGGYIDNTPATFARSATDPSIGFAGADGRVPANSVVINNSALAGSDINTVTYQGMRLEVFYQFHEDWSALLAQSYQSLDAAGVSAEMAYNSLGQPQPDLTVQLFNPSYNKDRFENTALTIDGRLGALHILYAGTYLVRNVDQVQDYTSYAHSGVYVDYYQCVNPKPGNPATAQCFTPSAIWRDLERNTHQSHELRLSTPDHWRIRGLGGLYYEKYQIQDQGDWYYLTALPYFNPIAPPTDAWVFNGRPVCPCTPNALQAPGYSVTSNNPDVRPLGDAFFNDITRGYDQKAAYASVDYELLPRTLTLTAGTRYFSNKTSQAGSVVGSFYCSKINNALGPPPDPCINRDFDNLDSLGLQRTYSGFRSRANLSWKVSGDALLYYTWSQGFRTGGFNRGFVPESDSPLSPGPGSWQAQARMHEGFAAPNAFAPDTVINNELGWKTSWLGQRLQWNGALYQEDWKHSQITANAFDDATLNGGNYRVRGLEISGGVGALGGFSAQIGAAWNHSALVRQGTFYWMDGAPVDFSSLHYQNGAPYPNPTGALGSPLAGAPPFQGNIRLRYERAISDYHASAQLGAVHQSHSISSTDQISVDRLGNSVAYDLPAFTSYDAALGIAKDAWLVELYGQNLTDTRAELYANNGLAYKAVTVSRPRTIGLHFSYKFRGR